MQKHNKLLIFVMILALLLAACGNGTTSGGVTNEPSTDTTPVDNTGNADAPTQDSGSDEDSTSGIGGTGDDASGDEPATPTPEGGGATSASNVIPDIMGFEIALTGFIESTLTTGGFYQCNSQVGIIQIGTTTGQNEQVTISFPLDSDVGVYDMVGAGEGTPGEDVTISLTSARVNLYGLGDGTLTLAAVGTAPGEQIAGTFTFSLDDGRNTVDGTGAFNFDIAEGSPLCTG